MLFWSLLHFISFLVLFYIFFSHILNNNVQSNYISFDDKTVTENFFEIAVLY